MQSKPLCQVSCHFQTIFLFLWPDQVPQSTLFVASIMPSAEFRLSQEPLLVVRCCAMLNAHAAPANLQLERSKRSLPAIRSPAWWHKVLNQVSRLMPSTPLATPSTCAQCCSSYHPLIAPFTKPSVGRTPSTTLFRGSEQVLASSTLPSFLLSCCSLCAIHRALCYACPKRQSLRRFRVQFLR